MGLMININYLLDWISEIITGLVIIFVLINAVNTNCFQTIEWGLTLIALMFSLFVRIIAGLTR